VEIFLEAHGSDAATDTTNDGGSRSLGPS